MKLIILISILSVTIACAHAPSSDAPGDAAARGTASVAPITKLSPDMERAGFGLQDYGGEWILAMPLLDSSTFVSAIDDGPKGYFTRLEIKRSGVNENIVWIEDSVGERAEIKYDTNTYAATYAYTGPDGKTKRDPNYYIRSHRFNPLLKATLQGDMRLGQPFYLITGYNPRAQQLELKAQYDPTPTLVQLKIPPQIAVRTVARRLMFLESTVGCSVSPETMGGLIEGGSNVVLVLTPFLMKPESPGGEESVAFITPTGASGVMGTVQTAVDSVVGAHYNCEIQRNGVTADGFKLFRSETGSSSLYVRRGQDALEVVPGLSWRVKGRITVTGEDSVRIVDRKLGGFSVTLNFKEQTYRAVKM